MSQESVQRVFAKGLLALLGFALCIIHLAPLQTPVFAQEAESGLVSFARDVMPVLRANCLGCHQPSKKQGGYLMTDFASLLAAGESGSAAVIPGNSADSYLMKEIVPIDGKAEMPKGSKPLHEKEIELIRRWIDQGAKNDSVATGPIHSAEHPPTYVRPPNISSLRFSPDGKSVAVAGYHEVILLDAESFQVTHRLIGLSPRIESIAYSPDNKWIAVAAGEPGVRGELQIWNNETKTLEHSYSISNDTLFGVNWSPDSTLISFACSDNSVRAVELSGTQKLYQRAHEDWARSTVFTADGKHLISASRDMTVKLTEVETERFIDNITSITPGALRGGMQAVTRHPQRDEILVGGADGAPKIYRVFRQTARVIGDDANLIRQMEPIPGRIFDVAISADGKYLAAVSTLDQQSVIRVWSYDVDAQLPPDIKAIQSKRVQSRKADEKKKLEAYVTAQPAILATWNVTDVAVYSLDIDARGRLAAGGSDGRVRVWGIADNKPIVDVDATPPNALATPSASSIADLRKARLQKIAETHSVEQTTNQASSIAADAITGIVVSPESIEFKAWHESTQLVVSATLSNGETRDVTRFSQFNTAGEQTWSSARGWVQPLQNGSTEVVVTFGSYTKKIPVQVAFAAASAADFVRDINPVLSRLGCNQGTCHGAQAGKSGFKLSLRGYDPIYDIRSLADDLAGRRLNTASPVSSLIMSKPLGTVPHVGGKLFEEGDSHALLLRQWIAEGAKVKLSTPRVQSIVLTPTNPTVSGPGDLQQLRVVATYTDGATRDVTREAFIETGNGEVAGVIEGARIQAIRRGEAPILARYEGAYAATTLTVMGDRTGYAWQPPASSNAIDNLVASKLQRMKIQPSELCTDTEFLRRVYIDLIGLPPSAEQVKAFLADSASSPEKRNRVIDELLRSDSFVEHWTNKWSDLLQVNSKFLGKEGATKFRDWIRQSIATNKPYNQFVHEIVGATGSNRENPAASYYKILRTPEDTVENTTHLFLGIRFNCNKCHDHPFERWTQDQYYQTAAYFAQVQLSKDNASGNQTVGGTAVEGAKPLYEVVADGGNNEVKHQRTQQPVPPQFPFPSGSAASEGASRRAQFAAWLTSPSNPYFAKSFVNRMWGYMLGKGLIEPIDDIRAGNPASIPELLEFLEKDFVANNFDFRHTLRTICNSETYQRSILPNQWNSDDDRNYSHAMPRRLPAEVLYDAIHLVTGSQSKLPGLTPGSRAASLADADAGLPDGFLNNLGRPPRESACECERSSELRLGSVMALVSGPTLGTAISDQNNSIHQLVSTISKDRELINELFLRVLNRPATDLEIEAATTVIARIEADHTSLADSLQKREEWWLEEKPKRQSQLDADKLATEQQLAARQESIRPQREAAEASRLERLAKAKADLDAFEGGIQEKLSQFIQERKNQPRWVPLQTQSTSSSNKAKLIAQNDRSIVASGSDDKGTYTIDTLPPETSFTSVRLEALTTADNKANGPGLAENGNFVVTEIELFVGKPDAPKEMRKLKIKQGLTDFDQAGFSAAAVFDDKPKDQGGWAIAGATGAEHWAVFALSEPATLQPGEVLQWRIHQYHDAAKHRLARFRLSVANHTGDLSIGLSESLTALASNPSSEWSEAQTKESIAYLRASSRDLASLRDRFNIENRPLPEDEQVVALKKRIERLSVPLPDDSRLVRLRVDVKESLTQKGQARLTAAEDITWALINSPAFLFNH